MGAARRMIVALSNRIGNGDTKNEDDDNLLALLELEKVVQRAAADAVERMRQHGFTDADIAEDLGCSRQAVSKRWPGRGRYLGTAARFGKRAAEEADNGRADNDHHDRYSGAVHVE